MPIDISDSKHIMEYRHLHAVVEQKDKDSSMSESECIAYMTTLMEYNKRVIEAGSSGNWEKCAEIIKEFINVFTPGAEIQSNILSGCIPVLFELIEVVEIPEVIDITLWLIARMLFYCRSLYNDVKEFMPVLYSLFDAMTTHEYFHLIDVMVNLFRDISCSIDFWMSLVQHCDILKIGGHVSQSYSHLIRAAISQAIVVRCDEQEAMWNEFTENVFSILSELQAEEPETIQCVMFVFGDICKYNCKRMKKTADLVLVNHFPQLCDMMQSVGDAPELAEATLWMFYWAITRMRYNAEVEVDFSLIPYDVIISFVSATDDEFTAIQYKAIQLLRLLCEIVPIIIAEHDIFALITTLWDDTPYRIQFQMLLIMAQFIYNPDRDTLVACATEAQQDPSGWIVEILQFMISKASEVSTAYLVMWAMKGLKWWHMRYEVQGFEEITDNVEFEEFIMTCQEMESDELQQMIDNYYYIGSSENTDEVLESQKHLEQLEEETKTPVIRFYCSKI